MFYKIKKIETLDNFKLLVTFCNDEAKLYDVGILLNKYHNFKVLSDITGLFEQVQVDAGGYGISWNNELDISCNELYFNGITI